MNDWVAISLIAVLLGLNAFFVGAEFALISSRRDRLEALLEAGKSRAKIVIKAGQNVSLMLAGAQLGITVCSLLLLQFGEPAVAHRLEAAVNALGVPLPAYVVHAVAFVVTLVAITLLHVLVGEMVPKNIAIAEPERMALWLVPVHVAWVRVVHPFLWLLNGIANGALRLMRVEPKDEVDTGYTSDELAALLSESRREGLIEHAEHRRLSQTLSSADKTVADIVVPMSELRTVPDHPTLGDVEAAVSATGFSRYPLRADDGELVGYLHVKDMLAHLGDDPGAHVPADKIRRLTELPVHARLDTALSAMRREGSHLATATDDSGAVVGVAALEDLVEEYVGTVRDGTHVT
ncbi:MULTISPECIES: hemolysin family protein [Prauserella salsuginis group]|uniref:Hemolysin family protein n=1 Tax=Prauserella salsuginis TaxID=387889 RepID=A0ABW6G464_9PSEU|nr:MULTISPECIES: hemolysin family protein [Prauserella salsuginis group]MCR3718262.1 Hemolysin, contains CBS domains [Prauserella flava]MCR3732832.1 Hemolysin, contains CBS domains [Prauserella salsuginis]